jgi:sucrose-6-phosphate hydrolase SacC (GH32 family)
VGDLDPGEDVDLRIYIDKYLVEVFVNDRQAVVAAYMDYRSARGLYGYSFVYSTTFQSVEIWRIEPTNQGFFDALENRVWQIDSSVIERGD